MKPKDPLPFGNVCHITANNPQSPTPSTKIKDQTKPYQHPRLGHSINNLVHRCSKLCSRRHPTRSSQSLSTCASIQTTTTPPPTSSKDHVPALAPQEGVETTASRINVAQPNDNSYRNTSTASSESSASSYTEAWNLSLILPFMHDPQTVVMECSNDSNFNK